MRAPNYLVLSACTSSIVHCEWELYQLSQICTFAQKPLCAPSTRKNSSAFRFSRVYTSPSTGRIVHCEWLLCRSFQICTLAPLLVDPSNTLRYSPVLMFLSVYTPCGITAGVCACLSSIATTSFATRAALSACSSPNAQTSAMHPPKRTSVRDGPAASSSFSLHNASCCCCI